MSTLLLIYLHMSYILHILAYIRKVIWRGGDSSLVKREKMEKTITMPAVEPRKFYRQYIELLQPILRLRKREADVFAELLYHNYLRRDITNEVDRFTLVFDISTRNKIGKVLGTKAPDGSVTPLSNAVIQQALGGLRKKNVIQGIKLRETFTIMPDEGVFNLTFKFVVNE